MCKQEEKDIEGNCFECEFGGNDIGLWKGKVKVHESQPSRKKKLQREEKGSYVCLKYISVYLFTTIIFIHVWNFHQFHPCDIFLTM
jgi:hypothetical protein